MIASYSMRFVSIENYAICKQKFEEKYGFLKRKETDIFGSKKIDFYNDQDPKWSYETYFYYLPQKLPMPLFQECHSCNESEHRYSINDYVIEQEGYEVGYLV